MTHCLTTIVRWGRWGEHLQERQITTETLYWMENRMIAVIPRKKKRVRNNQLTYGGRGEVRCTATVELKGIIIMIIMMITIMIMIITFIRWNLFRSQPTTLNSKLQITNKESVVNNALNILNRNFSRLFSIFSYSIFFTLHSFLNSLFLESFRNIFFSFSYLLIEFVHITEMW